MTPAVSVVVTVYNSERYLDECADSLKRQTFKDFEVLLVDPGSHDKSGTICRRLASEDSRFRYLEISGSSLVSYSRAKGTENARAPYIAVLDSDDRALPDRLEIQYQWMQAHPETVVAGTYYRVISQSGWIQRLAPLKITEDIEIRWRLLWGNCLGHTTVMYRKDAAERAGNYDAKIRAGEDFEFFTRMIDQGRMAVIPRSLADWRGHGGNLSKTEPVDYKSDFLTIVQNSIQREIGETISRPLAATLFHASRAPAESLTVFTDALALIERADDKMRRRPELTLRDRQLLCRSQFLQLIQLMSRNSSQPWWESARVPWMTLTRRLTAGRDGYRWYTDIGLGSYFKDLLKSDLTFLLMKGLY